MQIYLQENGTQTGPFDETVVRERLLRGTLPGQVYAWKEGMSDWRPLSELMPAALAYPATNTPTPHVPKPRMPLWGKVMVGCGGLATLVLTGLVASVAYLAYIDHKGSSHANTDMDKEFAAEDAARDKAWSDVQAEIERGMADPEHYTTTNVNNADGSTTTTVTPKANSPGRYPITKRVDADGEVTTTWTDAAGNTVQRTEDRRGNVRTSSGPAR